MKLTNIVKNGPKFNSLKICSQVLKTFKSLKQNVRDAK